MLTTWGKIFFALALVCTIPAGLAMHRMEQELERDGRRVSWRWLKYRPVRCVAQYVAMNMARSGQPGRYFGYLMLALIATLSFVMGALLLAE
jgi:hypothetical protein